MGDAGSWTMALLAILLAAPVTAAVAVLVIACPCAMGMAEWMPNSRAG